MTASPVSRDCAGGTGAGPVRHWKDVVEAVMEKTGNEIEFYVRPGKAAQYGPYVDLDMFDGRKKDKGGKIIEKWAIKMREEVSPEHDFDLIIVSVNHLVY
ncbi:MAG: hypothetical protein NHB14_19220 [Desulfosporosinus sp.]|nr:hypothetical protein [Desulfosporosinus sp.]MDA8223109.1 hypothetical protein [Desulfitobacterium hafniense]